MTKYSEKISVVVPCFCEEGNIEKLYERLRVALKAEDDWEVVFVDDGSCDKSWAIISKLNKGDPRVKGVSLSRNFGHQYAILAGLYSIKGDAAIIMDADLQHPPLEIPKLLQAWREGYMIVNMVRMEHPNTSFFKKLTSKMFYNLLSRLSGIQIERGMADFRLLDRKIAKKLLDFRESHLFLRGLVQWVGFPSTTIEYQCAERYSGSSKYRLSMMVDLAWTAFTSFSIVPLRIATAIGLSTSLLSFCGLIYALYSKYITESVVVGWTSLTSMISLLFGILFLVIGILGEYIARILEQVRGRPRYIIMEELGLTASCISNPKNIGIN